MPLYSLADGHGVALLSLTAITPQPAGDPVQVVQRNYAVSGAIQEQGAFAVWRWSMLETEAAYLALLTLIGLHNAESNEVTIYTRNQRMVWTRYNALATYPMMGVEARWSEYFARDIAVYFTKLVAL